MSHRLPILLLLLLSFGVCGQNVTYKHVDSCGCDIAYVDGIETTKSAEGLYGFRAYDGTVIAPNIYRFVDRFRDGYCKVLLDYGQCGLIDSTGRQIVPCIYDNTSFPAEGRVQVEKNGLCGYTDLNGNLIVPLQYVKAGDFHEGCAPVASMVDSFFLFATFIDTLGRQLFPLIYEDVTPFIDGLASVKKYQSWGLMDHSGRIVLPTIYETIIPLGDSLFFAGDQNGLALFNYRLKPLTPFVYSWVGTYSDRRVSVMRNGKYGFLDPTGFEIVPCIYDETGDFSYGRTMVRLANRYGIVDTMGYTILPIEYEDNSPKSNKYLYVNGLALVEKERRFGYVDLNGDIAIPLIYNDAYQFSEGLAPVRYGSFWGYIDTLGDVRIPFLFDLASPVEYDRAEVIFQGVRRKMDGKGNCLRNCNGIIAWKTRKQ